MFQDEVWVRGIHRVGLPIGLQGPMGHSLSISGILQLTIAAADLTIGAEVVALTENQGEDEFSGFADLI